MYKTGFQNLTKFSLKALRDISWSRYVGTTTETMEPMTYNPSERLSSSVRPLNYKLVLEPNLDNGKEFIGNVVIKINVKENTGYIRLHANLLEISDVKVFKDDQTAVPVTKFNLMQKVEQLEIEFARPIGKGIYLMHVDFKGFLSGFLGLYSAYTKGNR